jgi:hypothetical protein
VEVAREVLDRPDAGYRIVGFVGTDADLLGKSLINPRVIGITSELIDVVKRENIDRIVVAMGERRGLLPTDMLLQLSLAGTVSIEEGATFYERITSRVSLNMMRPSWLIFSGRGRQARLSGLLRNFVHRFVALVGGILSLPIALLAALLIKLDSRGPVFYRQERVGNNGKTFVLLKFRSMRVDAEQSGPFGRAKMMIEPRAWVGSFAKCASMRFPSFGTSCVVRWLLWGLVRNGPTLSLNWRRKSLITSSGI